MKIWALLLACTMALVSVTAEAKRLGGGKSFGRQSGNVTQRDATPLTQFVKDVDAIYGPRRDLMLMDNNVVASAARAASRDRHHNFSRDGKACV